MTEDFNNKLADALWTLLEPRIQKLIDSGDGLDIDNKIEQWMRYHFDLADYASIDITDYSHEIDGMVDAQVQYLAEDGDLKDWLDYSDSDFNERVFKALGEIDMKFGTMTVTYKDSVIVKE
jgi:hypothetical protein